MDQKKAKVKYKTQKMKQSIVIAYWNGMSQDESYGGVDLHIWN